MQAKSTTVFKTAITNARKSRPEGSLWPPEFAVDDPEAVWSFCKECFTWNEAAAERQRIPDLPFLREIVFEWHATRASGQPLGFEKSRRMVVSWLLCALDVWDAGLRRCNIIQGGKDFEKASDFVWRCYYIYTELQKSHPEWNLPDCNPWGNPLAQHLDGLALANESLIEPLNSDAEAFRGSGYTRVKLEELSSYRYVNRVLAQARTVTQGAPGERRGHVVFVSNAAVNSEWKDVKDPGKALPSITEAPFHAYDSKTGNRILRIHYSADPLKDEGWVEKESRGVPRSEWLREYELYDAEVADALWTQDQIDQNRVYELPKNITQILVSVDPSTTDPERAKNPSKKPDEVGILVGMVSSDGHAYVVEDLSGDMAPIDWARAAVSAYSKYRANRIVAEVNQGGDMVVTQIHMVGPNVPVERVHAHIGKRARAEPVALAYSQGLVHHLGILRGLEDEMLTWSKNSNKSPGRIDALTQFIKASGIMDNLGGGVAERFKSDSGEIEGVIPDATFNPYPEDEPDPMNPFNVPNPWAHLGWD